VMTAAGSYLFTRRTTFVILDSTGNVKRNSTKRLNGKLFIFRSMQINSSMQKEIALVNEYLIAAAKCDDG
jgi:hypothetical protein